MIAPRKILGRLGLTEQETCASPPTVSEAFIVHPAIVCAGAHAVDRFIEFFTAALRNEHTRLSYAHAVSTFFNWASAHGVADLRAITPVMIAAYIELLGRQRSVPTVKRHLAALRSLFDWMTAGGHMTHNPASSVRGPKHVVTKGTTPVLTAEETRQLLDSIPNHGIGLRDRALISLMVYTFARVSAAVGMEVGDYYHQGRRRWVRLHEKNGRLHHLPAHSRLEHAIDAYLEWLGAAAMPKSPLFRSFNLSGSPTVSAMSRHDAIRMVKRRALAAGLADTTCCHTFRATGVTTYLRNGGTLETAQAIAGHSSSRTTSLYDRRQDDITLGEIERIAI